MGKVKDITGQKFNRWTVLGIDHTTADYRVVWSCICDCGTRAVIRGSSLVSGNSKSCGCHRDEMLGNMSRKHGMCGTKAWHAWAHMLARCYSPATPSYYLYGGRGISVCTRWKKFENFYADMGDAPTDKHSIDRIDVNGNYEPSNCRWATQKEQANNRQSNTWLTAFGRTQTIAQWSDELGLKRATICQRIARGASHEEALMPIKPVRRTESPSIKICI